MSGVRIGHTVVLCGARPTGKALALIPGVRHFQWAAACTDILPQRPAFDALLAEQQWGAPVAVCGQPPPLAVNLSACTGLLRSHFLLPETAVSALAAAASGVPPVPALTLVR